MPTTGETHRHTYLHTIHSPTAVVPMDVAKTLYTGAESADRRVKYSSSSTSSSYLLVRALRSAGVPGFQYRLDPSDEH